MRFPLNIRNWKITTNVGPHSRILFLEVLVFSSNCACPLLPLYVCGRGLSTQGTGGATLPTLTLLSASIRVPALVVGA